MEWNELFKNQSRAWKELAKREGVKGRYTRITLDLSAAQSNQELAIEGDYIGVSSVTSIGTVNIRLDHRHSQNINLREVAEISSPFGKIYFTTDGGGGECILYIGGALTARLKPLQSKVSIRNIGGSDVDLVEAKRFISHTGGHLKIVQATLDTAKQLSASSIKVRSAILQTREFAMLWGFTSTVKQSTEIGQYVPAGGSVAVEFCDLSEIYFVDYDGANKPTVQCEYITEA